MQLPHGVERRVDVDFVVSDDRCVAVDVCRVAMLGSLFNVTLG
jgi:hypothetical protein